MKKLIFVLAVSVLACGAVSAATATMTDWQSYSGGTTVTDYGSSGFEVEHSVGYPDSFGVRARTVGGWLYDPNEPIVVTVSDFRSDDFDASDESTLGLFIGDTGSNSVVYSLPWTGNGTYTFKATDIVLNESSGSLEGEEVAFSEIYIWDDNMFYYANINPGAYGKVTFYVRTPDPVVEVPEPGVCAYALTGIAALTGIKRRIRK